VTMNSSGQPVSIPRSGTQEAQPKTKIEESEERTKSARDKSPPSKVKTWFKSRFSRGPKSPDGERGREGPSRRGFIGGASLTGIQGNESSASLDNRSTSVRAVALAGRNSGSYQSQPNDDPEAVSPVSSESSDEHFRDEVRDQPTPLTPPRPIGGLSLAQSHSPTRDSRFHEII
jgi:hypothetical protein